MKYLKDGDQTLRILQEPDAWKYYWEHFNPSGFPFPCSGERTTALAATPSWRR